MMSLMIIMITFYFTPLLLQFNNDTGKMARRVFYYIVHSQQQCSQNNLIPVCTRHRVAHTRRTLLRIFSHSHHHHHHHHHFCYLICMENKKLLSCKSHLLVRISRMRYDVHNNSWLDFGLTLNTEMLQQVELWCDAKYNMQHFNFQYDMMISFILKKSAMNSFSQLFFHMCI